jgi:hypothetical protein
MMRFHGAVRLVLKSGPTTRGKNCVWNLKGDTIGKAELIIREHQARQRIPSKSRCYASLDVQLGILGANLSSNLSSRDPSWSSLKLKLGAKSNIWNTLLAPDTEE